MQLINKSILFFFFILFVSSSLLSQAKLTIENISERQMTVKVMRSDGGNGDLFTTVSISPMGSEIVYFSETGYYFTKTKAVLPGKDPICKKGDAFEVYNGSDGYSVMTLTFTITESKNPIASGGKTISLKEFNEN